jgi:hypothetical protein
MNFVPNWIDAFVPRNFFEKRDERLARERATGLPQMPDPS